MAGEWFEEWFELRLTEEFQQDALRDQYPDLKDTRLLGPCSDYLRSGGMQYVWINHWKACMDCVDECNHEPKNHYSLLDSSNADGEDVDKEFLYMAAALGGKILKRSVDVTAQFRRKLV